MLGREGVADGLSVKEQTGFFVLEELKIRGLDRVGKGSPRMDEEAVGSNGTNPRALETKGAPGRNMSQL